MSNLSITKYPIYSSASEFITVPFSYRTVSYRTRTVLYHTVFRFPLYRKFFKIVYRTVLFSAFIAKTANLAVKKGNYFPFFIQKARLKSHKSKNRFSLHKGKREPYCSKKNRIFITKIYN